MSAAEQRAALAAIGNDLVAVPGGPGERRAAMLLRQVEGGSEPAGTLDDLARAPDWLRLPAAAQRRLTQRVALLSMGDTLTSAIDGAWLGSLAERVGEDILDWALATIAEDTVRTTGGRIAAGDLEAHGLALLRLTLPEALHPYLAWQADTTRIEVDIDRIPAWIERSVAAS